MPIAQVLNTRIPVISDLAGRNYTLLDLAREFGTVSDSTADFISTVIDFTNFSNRVRSTLNRLVSGGVLQFGNFSLDPTAATDPSKLGKLALTAGGSTNFSTTSLNQLKDERRLQPAVPEQPVVAVQADPRPGHHAGYHDMPKLDFGFRSTSNSSRSSGRSA